MVLAVALWSVTVTPGKKVEVVPQADLKIVNVALGHELADTSGRTTLTMTYKPPTTVDEDDEEEENEADGPESTTVLCSLTPGKIEQAMIDLILGEDETYEFEATGKNTLYLTGNYIDQNPMDDPPFYGDSEDEEDEEAYDLREVSSDVEMNPDEIGSDDDSRFEELPDIPKTLKRDSEAVSADEKDKAGRSDKRIKGADGKAMPAPVSDATVGDTKEKKKKKKKKDKQEKDGQLADQPQAQADKKGAAPKAMTKEIAGGIKIKDTKVGSGPQAKKGHDVSMRYIGKLENGKVFDSNTKGKPFTFSLGKGNVIKGWDEGIVGMQVGGERVLTIPPSMAYGKKKMADIPPDSTLIFECKLLQIK